jgi:membrane-bound inhibitor of C-type lysozyme
MGIFITSTLQQMLLPYSDQEGSDRQDMQYACGNEKCMSVRAVNVKGRDYVEDGRIVLKRKVR